MGSKKRRRSEHLQDGNDSAHKRLATSVARSDPLEVKATVTKSSVQHKTKQKKTKIKADNLQVQMGKKKKKKSKAQKALPGLTVDMKTETKADDSVPVLKLNKVNRRKDKKKSKGNANNSVPVAEIQRKKKNSNDIKDNSVSLAEVTKIKGKKLNCSDGNHAEKVAVTKKVKSDDTDIVIEVKPKKKKKKKKKLAAKQTMVVKAIKTPSTIQSKSQAEEKSKLASQAEEKTKTSSQLINDKKISHKSKDDHALDISHANSDNMSLFTRLIDSAARERWELVEVGRLVRLFAAEWDFEEDKTAHFLCEMCPELVNLEFLEGLGVNLTATQLIQIFEAGSGNSEVLINKLASALENEHLSVQDTSFISVLTRRIALMESNDEVMELVQPLLESLFKVRDVGHLLKHLCAHWQPDRKIALVQQVLLSKAFDDMEGNQDEILLDLPDLGGRLDFPSRLDQDDVDEEGNLKGFIVDEEDESSGEDTSNEEDEYDGKLDDEDGSEDEEIPHNRRGHNRARQFIEDEAAVGDEMEEESQAELSIDEESSSTDSE